MRATSILKIAAACAMALSSLCLGAAEPAPRDKTDGVAEPKLGIPKTDPEKPSADPAKPDTPKPKPTPNPKPADLVDGWAKTEGLLDVYRKEDKSFAQIPQTLLDQPLWVSSNLRKGLGSSAIYANASGPSWVARFHLGPNNILQLVASNARAAPVPSGAPETSYAKLAEASFSESLLGAWAIKAIDDQSVLIDGNALTMSDIGSWSPKLEAAYKIPYAFDSSNSSIADIANSATETIFAIRAHFYSPKIPPGARGASLPDARSAFIETTLSFSTLPKTLMKPRALDERVGLFHVERLDLNPADKPRDRIAYGARWRLEKLDPLALQSAPVDPIRFEICPEMPQKYRDAAIEGILEWNEAFEAIGFQGALRARALDQEDGVLAGGRKATVCFIAADDANTAVGPSKMDPRTGEILEARVIIPEVFANLARFDFDLRKPVDSSGAFDEYAGFSAPQAFVENPLWSDEARERLAMDYFRLVVAHEVGHALGLRHNFKGSAAYPFKDLSAPSFSGQTTASVMDYVPANIYARRSPQNTRAYQDHIGAYDQWAIAYAYSAYPDEASERSGLKALLDRSEREPELAFATDEDAYGENALDPLANVFDLSANPLDFSRSRFELAQYTIDTMAARARLGTLDPDQASRALNHILQGLSRAGLAIHRYFGGATLHRQQGSSRQPVLESIDPAVQRDAMSFLTQTLLGRYIDIPPELLSRAVPSALTRSTTNPSFDFENKIEVIQRSLIKPFFTPVLTDQIMDARRLWIPSHGAKPPMTLLEVETAIKRAVFSELYKGKPTERSRRDIQRDYVDYLCSALKTPANLSTDPRGIFRDIAEEISRLGESQSQNKARAPEDRSHLRDLASSLKSTLNAQTTRDKP